MSEDDYDIFGMSDKSIHSGDESNPFSKKHEGIDGAEDQSHQTDPKNDSKNKPVKTRKFTKNPQLKLDPNRLCSQRGIAEVASNFKNVKLKGKGHEKADLDLVLSKMEHWAHRLFPKLSFDDCVDQIAKIGANRSVQVYMKRFRDETTEPQEEEHNQETEEVDNTSLFDKIYESTLDSTIQRNTSMANDESFTITQEQQNRMLENKRRAEEKRKSRQTANNVTTTIPSSNNDDTAIAECPPPIAIEEDAPKKSDPQPEDMDQETDLMGIDDFLENLPDQ